MPSREQQARITVSLDNVSLGVWDDKTGGETDTNSVQYFLGGMGPRVSLGGSQQVGNLVLAKLYDDDIRSKRKFVIGRCGKGIAVVTVQDLDDEGAAIGDPDVYATRLKRATPPPRNAQNNTAAQFEIELEVDGAMA
jgi:hypothetical protein